MTNLMDKPLDPSSKASLLGGAPLAAVTVWVIQTYYLPKGYTLEAPIAVGLGAVGATVFGELWQLLLQLINILLEKLRS